MNDYLVGFSNSVVRFANSYPTPEDATAMEPPIVVSPAEWRAARHDIRTPDNAGTHRGDAPASPAEVVR